MSQPEAFFEQGFAEGGGELHMHNGDVWELPVPTWTADAGPGDRPLLTRCTGATLDVGCGPGRMVAALGEQGIQALGVDVSPLAVAMTRSRGASALNRDIFSLDHGPRLWQHVLLVDGNVGIGGDPIRLLWLCRQLLAPGGTVLVDLAPPGHGLVVTSARFVGSNGPGDWFGWALLGVDAVDVVAAAAGLEVTECWQVEGEPRWQAELVCSDRWDAPGPSTGSENSSTGSGSGSGAGNGSTGSGNRSTGSGNGSTGSGNRSTGSGSGSTGSGSGSTGSGSGPTGAGNSSTGSGSGSGTGAR